MNKIMLRYYFLGGLLLGILRGLTEVIRLHSSYPLNTGLLSLSMQIIPLYGLTIGILGLAPALAIQYLFKKRNNIRSLLPIAWLSVLIGLDIWGFWTPLPETCRHTFGMPPQFSVGKEASDLLIFTLDTCRADYLGVYGNNFVRTPTLDRLARTGSIVIDTIAPIPITTSSHATIFTGQDPSEHGSRFNAVPINADSSTMAEIFRNHGYRTGAFVSAFPVVHEVSGLARGFDIYDQLLTPSHFHPLLYRSSIMRGFTRYGPFRPAERKWFRMLPPIQKWWSNNTEQPQFTWVHFYDPHFPYEPGFPFDTMYLTHPPQFKQNVFDIAEINRTGIPPNPEKIDEFKRLYAGEITAVDHAVGHLIRALYQQQRLTKTAIVITADHGESLDEHDYYFAHGNNLHDPSIRVPLIFSFPDRLAPNHIVSGQIKLASLAEIIYTLLNISGSQNTPSRYIDVSEKGSLVVACDNYAFCETGVGVFTAVHEPSRESIRRKHRAVRSSERKVIVAPENHQFRYNIAIDPSESVSYPTDQTFLAMTQILADYVLESDALTSFEPVLPDEHVLRQLKSLGYME